MKVVLSLLFCITATLADIAGECDLAGFYQELGCSAVHTDPSGKCPDSFSCRDLHPNPNMCYYNVDAVKVQICHTPNCPVSFSCPDLHPDPNMCYYKGVTYSDGSNVPQELVSNRCSIGCFCQMRSGPRFACAAVDCFETADKDLKECIPTYKLDECCSAGSVCGKDAIAKLATCEYDGNTYLEGQRFEPKNSRKTCVCNAQFNGSIDDPAVCRDLNCGLELHYQDSIMKNCAPVFYGTANKMGCPIQWVCPSNETSIVAGMNIGDVKEKCVFGNSTLNVGDEVVVSDDKCMQCACQVPPFVACSRRSASQEECAKG